MSFQQGLSGLNSASTQLATIGNNVANASTVGFKQSQTQFADMYAASMSGSTSKIAGSGSSVATIAQLFTQGNVSNSTNPMDVAIKGNGFFQVDDGSGTPKYSRNGQFQVDPKGYIVNAQSGKITGYAASANGKIIPSTTPKALQISTAPMQANQTNNITMGTNLDATQRPVALPIDTTVPASINLANTVPIFDSTNSSSYTNSTAVTVYDAAGTAHVGSVYFQRQPINETAIQANVVSVSVNGATMTLGTPAGTATMLSVHDTITDPASGIKYTVTGVTNDTTVTVSPTSTGTLAAPIVFATAPLINAASNTWNAYMTVDGQLVTPVPAPVAPPPLWAAVTVDGGVTYAAGYQPATPTAVMQFDASGNLTSVAAFGAAGTTVAPMTLTAAVPVTDNSGATLAKTVTFSLAFAPTGVKTTQYASGFGVTTTQDGNASGTLNNFTFGADGVIAGQYSNGKSQSLGQVLLANFTNPQGLQPIGNNEWLAAPASGDAQQGNVPGSNGIGILQASATEDSNVDLTAELVNMITAQRSYQANAQTIKAQDQIMQTAVNL
jgi:flagellar hook protein FlgE